MGDRFVVCAGCFRHAKDHEACCPFCGSSLAEARPSGGEPFRRMAAAAAVAAGVVSVTGCSSGHSVGTFYGTTSFVEVDSGSSSDGGADDAPAAVVFYGSPNFDAVAPQDTGTSEVDAAGPADGGGDAAG